MLIELKHGEISFGVVRIWLLRGGVVDPKSEELLPASLLFERLAHVPQGFTCGSA
jgi:hypothetical protein